MNTMTSFRGASIGTGIIIAIIGIVLLAYPTLSMGVFATLVGLGILIVGINACVVWGRNLRGSGFGIGVLIAGILSIIFGFLCMVYPYAFAEVLTWFIAIMVIVFGIAQTISLIATPLPQGKVIGVLGNIVVVLCGILAFIWPPFIMQFIGASLLIEGITVVIVALMVPKID